MPVKRGELCVLVVGDDSRHNLDVVLDPYLADGWSLNVVRMTDAEWQLSHVVRVMDNFVAAGWPGTIPAIRDYLKTSLQPVAEGSKFTFEPYEVYRKLGTATNTLDSRQLVAHHVVRNLHSKQNPLVAVVLSVEACNWQHASTAWFGHFPANLPTYVMHPDGRLVQTQFGAIAHADPDTI